MSQGLEELIARSRAGDRAAGEQLIVENSGLIWSIARRYFGRGVDPDDLYQLGCLGFLKAVEGYDTTFGTQFSTYAVPKIAGEIRRFLRDDGSVKSQPWLERALRRHQNDPRPYDGRAGQGADCREISPGNGPQCRGNCHSGRPLRRLPNPSKERPVRMDLLWKNVLTDSDTEERLVERIALREAIGKLPERGGAGDQPSIFPRLDPGTGGPGAAGLPGAGLPH